MAGSTGTRLKRFVSVTANITDCRSVATGSPAAAGRTNRKIKCSICVDGGVPVFHTGGECSIHSYCTELNVDFSLTGKVPHCECGEQGSRPGVNQNE